MRRLIGYEYKIISLVTFDERLATLNEWGSDGWLLVNQRYVLQEVAYELTFAREIR